MSDCKTCFKAYAPIRASSLYCSTGCAAASRRADTLIRAERGEPVSEVPLRRILHEKFGGRCQGAQCAWNFERRIVRCHVEHIDGDSTNNVLSNLTLLCPNCHSLTPTYKNRNKGKGRAARSGRAFQ